MKINNSLIFLEKINLGKIFHTINNLLDSFKLVLKLYNIVCNWKVFRKICFRAPLRQNNWHLCVKENDNTRI